MNTNTPHPVRRALKRLGNDIRDARRRRRIPMWLAAERASISRATLAKIEKGDEGVSLGAWGKILFILGLIDKLAEVAAPKFDQVGLDLEAEKLPKRIRIPQSERRSYGTRS